MIVIPYSVVITCMVFGILTLIFAIVLLISGIAEKEHGCLIVSIILFAILIPIIVIFAIPGIASDVSYEDTKVDTVNLYALSSGNGVKGSFVFGCGTSDDVQYYIGYTNVGDNSYKQVKFNANSSILKLDDSEIPRVDVYSVSCRVNSLIPDVLCELKTKTKYLIYIPHDGLSNTYSVN